MTRHRRQRTPHPRPRGRGARARGAPAGRRLRARGRAAPRRGRTGHRLRGREVRPDRPEDRGDVHLDGHALRLPPSGRQPAWRSRRREPPRRRGRCSARAVRPRSCSGSSARWSGCRCPIVALTGNPASSLARAAAVVLDAGVEEEACPLDLAPTTSTTVALGPGRRARGGPPRAARLLAPGLRGVASGRNAGAEAAAPGARRDGAGGRGGASRHDDARRGHVARARARAGDGGGGRPGHRRHNGRGPEPDRGALGQLSRAAGGRRDDRHPAHGEGRRPGVDGDRTDGADRNRGNAGGR